MRCLLRVNGVILIVCCYVVRVSLYNGHQGYDCVVWIFVSMTVLFHSTYMRVVFMLAASANKCF